MKKFFILTIVIILISCSTKRKEYQLKEVIIAGRVLNPNPDESLIEFTVNRIGVAHDRLSGRLTKDGSFKIKFKSYVPTDVWLVKMNFLILTHPGDSIFLEFDDSKENRLDMIKSIKFQGDASILNNETASFQKIYFASDIYANYDKKRKAIKEYNEIDFKKFRDSLHVAETELLKKFTADYYPSSETQDWIKIYLEVEYLRDLISYPDFHRMFNNLKREKWNVPITYYNFLKNHFPIIESNLINGYSISGFVNAYSVYINEKSRYENKTFFSSIDTVRNHPDKLDSLRIFGIIKYTDDPLLRQMALTENLYQSLEQSNIRAFEKYKSTIESYIVAPYLKEPLFDLYNQTVKRLDNPIIASESVLQKLTGTSIKSEIDKIIANNKGKVIYLDCWATWCGPCISEFPNSKKLLTEYKNKNVAFIFICLDSEEINWEPIIKKYSLAGQHYFLTKNQSSDFREVFGIRGIPHYILFDTKGNISENGTASPSFIKDKLDNLLTEN